MPIPDYQTLLLPLLELASDGEEHSLKEAREKMADHFELGQDERRKLLPGGTQTVIYNRTGWARTYLKKAGILIDPKRGYFKITECGKELLRMNPSEINVEMLKQFEGFRDFVEYKKTRDEKPTSVEVETSSDTPEEVLENAVQRINENLADGILENIGACSPSFFERLVVELLVRMGYGGSLKEAGNVLGRTGDGGIDGIIKEDKLGLDIIYIQAKRWENVVSRPEIQRFVGALQGQRARKGIFITTSHYSRGAEEYVRGIENKVVLIDGNQLAQLMIENNLGVSIISTYEIKRIDTDYFIEE
ncbi:MAG: restriction endonuclease [Candidatus Latescibacteria bacterium]|nr:restriction endonuclease [Candidatus Latescibacterota bacterium]